MYADKIGLALGCPNGIVVCGQWSSVNLSSWPCITE